MYSQDSIDLLANSGLQFQKHEEEGIDTLHFAELLMTSGVVLCDNVKWLSFHRSVSVFLLCFGSCFTHMFKTGPHAVQQATGYVHLWLFREV